MILEALSLIEKAYKELKSKKTQDELEEIFDTGEDISDKLVDMFHIGVDAADDAVKMFILTVSVFERIMGTERSRGLTQESPFETIVADIVEEIYPITTPTHDLG